MSKLAQMNFSKHIVFSKIKDSDNYFIVNLLSGSASILSPSEAADFQSLLLQKEINNKAFISELIENKYIIDEAEEASIYKHKYLDFLDAREEDEVQLFFVPNYACNFACSYCYQDEYSNPAAALNEEIIDSFFQYVKREFVDQKKYITVFGGEPLLDSPRQKQLIQHIISRSNEQKLDLCFVTNGYSLTSYIEILKQGRVREIQVTLDGTADIHNKRRFLKGGGASFDKIVEGIDACLKNGLDVNLRMVIDKENIDNLPELATFAINKGWTRSPYFKSQIGRNYELHHCQSAQNKLFTRIALYEKMYELCKIHPQITQFYKPTFSVSKFLFENGTLPDPLFDSCPACKTEWAFDYTGQIYPCTATVGKASESLGSFYPSVTKNKDRVADWESRDVTSISECSNCSMQLACGGGCGSVAKNNTGKVCSTDCRPIKELLELGVAHYFNEKNEPEDYSCCC